MTDTREKLIELLKDADEFARYYREIEANGLVTKEDPYAIAADYLIANGVTVQGWIPASEPPKDDLPVLVTCGRGYRPFVARYDRIWKRWKVSHTLKITHWQPLPITSNLPEPAAEE